MKFYKDVPYAISRLVGTIVRYKGEPVEVIGKDDPHVRIQYLMSKRKDWIDVRRLDINPVPLGYLNSDEFGCTYLSRIPMRSDWRQGLRQKAIKVSNGLLFDAFDRKDVAKTILNIYPHLKDARNMCDDVRRVAFAREWCIGSKDTIWYKEKEVGKYMHDRIALKPEYFYLEEKLMELQHEEFA